MTARLLTFWLIENPIFDGAALPCLAVGLANPSPALELGFASDKECNARKIKQLPNRRSPLWYTALKSCRCLSRCAFGSATAFRPTLSYLEKIRQYCSRSKQKLPCTFAGLLRQTAISLLRALLFLCDDGL